MAKSDDYQREDDGRIQWIKEAQDQLGEDVRNVTDSVHKLGLTAEGLKVTTSELKRQTAELWKRTDEAAPAPPPRPCDDLKDHIEEHKQTKAQWRGVWLKIVACVAVALILSALGYYGVIR